jgi:drug/metabolite transporter, DME family
LLLCVAESPVLSVHPESNLTMSVQSMFRAREGLFAVSAGAVLWGTNGVLVRYVSDHSTLSAVSIGFYRLVFSSLVLLLLAGLTSIRVWRVASSRQRVLLTVSGLLLGAYQALYFAAIGNVGVSVSTLVSLGVAPLAITVTQSIRSQTLPPRRTIVVLGLALIGLGLISLSSSHGLVGAASMAGHRRISGIRAGLCRIDHGHPTTA